jgi:hypothetical protein
MRIDMATSEGIESYLLKSRLAATREIKDIDSECLCRLQILVAELLNKNEILRRQLKGNARTFATLQHLLEKGVSHASTDGDVISPVLQAYALLAREA